MNTAERKRALRLQALNIRAQQKPHAASAALAIARFSPKCSPQTIIAAYWPIRTEISPLPLLNQLHKAGFRLALPVFTSLQDTLSFRLWKPGLQLVRGPSSIPQPPPEQETLIPDLLFLPLLAFDLFGTRLGYGSGLYDRALEHLRSEKNIRAIGLAFAAQQVPHIPCETHDQRLDAVLTENGLYEIPAKKQFTL